MGLYDDSVLKRFWSKVDKRGDDECWPWSQLEGRHYGTISIAGKPCRAHKVSWSIQNNAPFPDGMNGCHKCDNPPCVNPHHIFPGTRRDNFIDCRDKGRHAQVKLRHSQVAYIKLALSRGLGLRHLARCYGVNLRTIQFVARGETWSDVAPAPFISAFPEVAHA